MRSKGNGGFSRKPGEHFRTFNSFHEENDSDKDTIIAKNYSM